MNEPENIRSLLRDSKTIAVVGLSAKSQRDSHRVATYLREAGYTIIPVNPSLTQWEGLPAYPSLGAIPWDREVDVVNVFRRPEEVFRVVEEVILYTPEKKIKGVWFQEGVIDDAAAFKAERARLKVVMNRCIMKEHASWKVLSNSLSDPGSSKTIRSIETQ